MANRYVWEKYEAEPEYGTAFYYDRTGGASNSPCAYCPQGVDPVVFLVGGAEVTLTEDHKVSFVIERKKTLSYSGSHIALYDFKVNTPVFVAMTKDEADQYAVGDSYIGGTVYKEYSWAYFGMAGYSGSTAVFRYGGNGNYVNTSGYPMKCIYPTVTAYNKGDTLIGQVAAAASDAYPENGTGGGVNPTLTITGVWIAPVLRSLLRRARKGAR